MDMKRMHHPLKDRRSLGSLLGTFVTGLLLISGCGAKEEKDPEAILKEKKAEMSRLKERIAELKEKVGGSDTASGKEKATLVELRQVRPRTFVHSFRISGTVEAENAVVVSPESQGNVKEVHVKEGDRVEKGELMGKLNTAGIREQMEEVRTNLSHAKTVFERKRRLWKEKGIGSEIDYLNAKNNKESLEARLASLREQLEMARITSPVSGIVDKVHVKKGQFSGPGQRFADVVNLDRLSIKADVPEKYLPRVHEGDTVDLFFPSLGIRKKTPIQHVGNRIDPRNRTAAIHLEIDNDPEWTIKANALAEIRVRDRVIDSTQVIPSRIIRNDLQGDFIYTTKRTGGDLVARKSYIETGMSQGNSTRVRAGLENGDRVVVKGYNDLVDQAPIREK